MVHQHTQSACSNDIATESTSLLLSRSGVAGTIASDYAEPRDAELGHTGSGLDADNGFAEYDSTSTSEIAKQEAGILAIASVPLALACLLQSSFSFVNVLSLGHLGADELAAAALGNMTVFMLVNAPAAGLATALDTFCSTAFTGSRDRTLVGFHLQRGIIAATLHFAIVLPVLIYIEPIFILLRQNVGISYLCSRFIRAQLPGLLPWMYFECIKRFLQAQGHMKAGTYVLIATLPLHLANTYLFVWSPTFGFGFLGAAAANVVTFWAMLIGIVVYCWRTDARAAWGGWTRRSVIAMPQYYRLAIPSMIMVCSCWVAWELMAIAASYLGNVTLAAQSIVINTCSLTYQGVSGLRTAVSNRTGNLLGQARARRAEISSSVGLSLGLAWGMATTVAYFIVASWWGSIYTSDLDVIAGVALIMPICGIFELADSVTSVSGAVLRSFGQQAYAARISVSAYYIVGLPLGLYLTYGWPEMGVVGLWIGLSVGGFIIAIRQTVICLRANYAEEVKKCLVQVTRSQCAADCNATSQ
ncbi:ethionine resistance protein [Coemansia sp. RSA 1813]|nr:ethionine resistance protein [Coemansia sp. RSA 1843]KAJ2091913.1 ethionine resistance protein [Coemansia sp. RSA 986]KAJ2212462.1 ethionine resistance protein [Coemansia sp. RSA 487]KAJ2571692.1 ethionine resistance protein [Coemansia sp. RSA 1813]